MKSKWLRFILVEQGYKTSIWVVENKKNDVGLGVIKWNPLWRQYNFIPNNDTIYSQSCLRDIAEFIKKLMDERKKNK